jgi:hypothetical protein
VCSTLHFGHDCRLRCNRCVKVNFNLWCLDAHDETVLGQLLVASKMRSLAPPAGYRMHRYQVGGRQICSVPGPPSFDFVQPTGLARGGSAPWLLSARGGPTSGLFTYIAIVSMSSSSLPFRASISPSVLTWTSESFAYADGFDEAGGRYRGSEHGEQHSCAALIGLCERQGRRGRR